MERVNEQLEQTELKTRTNFRQNIKEALGDVEYDKLEKGPGGNRKELADKKTKFNKLVLDVNAGRLPITALDPKQEELKYIKQYLTEANKKDLINRFLN